jgi:hypothetical protein
MTPSRLSRRQLLGMLILLTLLAAWILVTLGA